jgi:hypothetical protein
MVNPIYFVVSAIPEPLRTILKEKEALPPPQTLQPQVKTWVDAEWNWTCETFLNLKDAGLDVVLVEQPVAGAICISHFDTTKNKIWAPDSFVVGIRADRSPFHMCEIEIVQSPANLTHSHQHLICFWPMPGLLPRDAQRGDRIEQISYFGGEGGFAPQFRTPAFKQALRTMGVELKCYHNPYDWHDFRETDLVLAIRNHLHPLLIETKPPSKLINAWQAGCVALLGSEPAYQAIGRSGKDYFEVQTPEAVLERVAYLKAHPQVYQQMRQAGCQKASAYGFAAIRQQWIDLLTGPAVTEAYTRWQKGIGKNPLDRRQRRVWQAMRQWLDHKLFFGQVRLKEFVRQQFSLRHPVEPVVRESPIVRSS